MPTETIGEIFQRARFKAELSRREVADAAHMSEQALMNIEFGRSKPRGTTIYALCRVLDLDPDSMLGQEVAS